jgi:hypothetical protein
MKQDTALSEGLCLSALMGLGLRVSMRRAEQVYMALPLWEEEEIRRRERVVMIGGIFEAG